MTELNTQKVQKAQILLSQLNYAYFEVERSTTYADPNSFIKWLS